MGKPLRCRLGMHRWQQTYDHERELQVKVCRVCAHRMSKGWPRFIGDMGGAGGGGTG